jgi:hypothetical protein
MLYPSLSLLSVTHSGSSLAPYFFVRHDTGRFLNTSPVQHRFLLPPEIGKLIDVLYHRSALQCVIDRTVPGHDCEIGVHALLADEPSPIIEDPVQHPCHAFCLVPIAGLSGRQLLRVAYIEAVQRHKGSSR